MNPARGGSYLRFLQDPTTGPSFSHSLSQPVDPPHPGFIFSQVPVPFPPFCTQPRPPLPPPSAAPSPAATPASTYRSGRRRRVSATPEAGEERGGRMYYDTDKDLRLVSAWFNNSTDPIEGVSRKGETYWTLVAETYNQTTPDGRKRDADSLKGHWHRTTKKVTLFNGCYCQLKDSYASGRNDDQLMGEAMELYKSCSKGQTFGCRHWWRAVCDSPKWNAHVSSYGKEPRKFTPNLNMNVVPTPQERPMGVKRAKASQKDEDKEMKEFQQKLADKRLEATNIQLPAVWIYHRRGFPPASALRSRSAASSPSSTSGEEAKGCGRRKWEGGRGVREKTRSRGGGCPRSGVVE